MIPIMTHSEIVINSLMETIVFAVRPPMINKDKEFVPIRDGSKPNFRHLDFINITIDMTRPHSDDPETMPVRPQDLLF